MGTKMKSFLLAAAALVVTAQCKAGMIYVPEITFIEQPGFLLLFLVPNLSRKRSQRRWTPSDRSQLAKQRSTIS